MSGKPGDNIRLQHILDAIEEIENYTRGVQLEEFVSNSMMFNATLRQREIIGKPAIVYPKNYCRTIVIFLKCYTKDLSSARQAQDVKSLRQRVRDSKFRQQRLNIKSSEERIQHQISNDACRSFSPSSFGVQCAPRWIHYSIFLLSWCEQWVEMQWQDMLDQRL